jgi:hypothetical protein
VACYHFHSKCPNETLLKLGSYSCTTTINYYVLTSVLLDYLQKTENTLDAHLLYLILNIRASASTTKPTLPAPSPTSLPQAENYLGNLFSGNLSTFVYSPRNLQTERADLNSKPACCVRDFISLTCSKQAGFRFLGTIYPPLIIILQP